MRIKHLYGPFAKLHISTSNYAEAANYVICTLIIVTPSENNYKEAKICASPRERTLRNKDESPRITRQDSQREALIFPLRIFTILVTLGLGCITLMTRKSTDHCIVMTSRRKPGWILSACFYG